MPECADYLSAISQLYQQTLVKILYKGRTRRWNYII